MLSDLNNQRADSRFHGNDDEVVVFLCKNFIKQESDCFVPRNDVQGAVFFTCNINVQLLKNQQYKSYIKANEKKC